MFLKRKAAPVFGASFTIRHDNKELMNMTRIRVIAVFAALVAVMSIGSVSSAFGYGQCGGSISSGVQQLKDVESFGLKSEFAAKLKEAGYKSEDGSVKSFMEDRTVIAPLAQTLTIEDNACYPHDLLSVRDRTYAAGEEVVVVLPKTIDKKLVRSHKVKNAAHKRIKTPVIGRKRCANPLGPKFAYVWIWLIVEKKVTVHKKPEAPKPTPKETPREPVAPPASIVITTGPITVSPVIVNEQEQGQGQTQGQQQQQQNCIAAGNFWNEVKQTCEQHQVQCNTNQVLINGSCQEKSCSEMGTCKKEEPAPKCEPGEEGTPPNCKMPECPKGDTGKYPNCQKPECPVGDKGTYPECEPPQPPKFIDVVTPNDVEAGGTYRNSFCSKVQMWGSDTGTLTEAPRFGAFGEEGETRNVMFTVSNTHPEECVTYAAPGEVPKPGEQDEVTITVTDNQHPNLSKEVVVDVHIDPSPEEHRPSE